MKTILLFNSYLRKSLDKLAFDNCKISNVWVFVKNDFTPPDCVDGGKDFIGDIYNRRSLHGNVANEWKN